MTAARTTAVDHLSARAEADRLVAEGRMVEAVDLLQAAYLELEDPDTALRLIDLRARASLSEPVGVDGSSWPLEYADPFPDVGDDALPEVDTRSLSTETVAGAVQHHGAVVVRGALAPERADTIVEVIRAVETHREAHRNSPLGGPPPADRSWTPFNGVEKMPKPQLTALREKRGIVGDQGGTWLADSPRGTAIALGALRSCGLVDLMTSHFGTRPSFSLQKSTLRRSKPQDEEAGWHQDGSFMGTDARTLNVWIALSDCGGDLPTPGLEVIPKRVDEILPVDGGLGNVSISRDTIAAASGHVPSVIPLFAKGDALIFDQYFVHRSHFTPGMTTDRFALECWMFAGGYTPPTYIPLLV